MSEKFAIGDEVFTHNPGSFIEGASCIIGVIDEIVEIDGRPSYRFNADVFIKRGLHQYKTQRHRVERYANEIGHRIGIPLSSLNGNAANRHRDPDSWDRWVAFSNACGYP